MTISVVTRSALARPAAPVSDEETGLCARLGRGGDGDAPAAFSRMRTVRLDYRPRPHQREAHRRKRRETVLVWHRRAGKTTWCAAELVHEALRWRDAGRDVLFWYVAPKLKQARAILWAPLKRLVRPLLAAGLAQIREAELAVVIGDARIQLVGALDPDSLRGTGLVGVVYDECAQMPPEVWSEIVKPMLADHHRHAWEVWIGTPKGPNHFKDLFDAARARMEAGDPDVHVSRLTVHDTGVLDPAFLELARQRMDPEEFRQEFECDWSAAVRGAYYADLLEEMERDGRIGHWPAIPERPAVTAWDLGVADDTAIWVAQPDGGGWRLVRCLTGGGRDFAHYARELDRLGLRFRRHYLPHDAAARDIGSARTRIAQLHELGVRPAEVVPRHRVDDGIAAVRALLRRARLDLEGCRDGLQALRLYRREWLADRGVFRPVPVHDWTSHAADALRYLAVGAGVEPRDIGHGATRERPRRARSGPVL